MSDPYGIAPALETLATQYFENSRRTGRTSLMIKMLKGDETIVFASEQDAKNALHNARKKGKSFNYVIAKSLDDLYDSRRADIRRIDPRRITLDHRFYQMVYESELKRVNQRLTRIARAFDYLTDESTVPELPYHLSHVGRVIR
jgi:Txe/YoeB family toxin of Txe-Axe toxin-antitoxin module